MLLISKIRYSEQKPLEFALETLIIYATYFEPRYFEHFAISNVFSGPMS